MLPWGGVQPHCTYRLSPSPFTFANYTNFDNKAANSPHCQHTHTHTQFTSKQTVPSEPWLLWSKSRRPFPDARSRSSHRATPRIPSSTSPVRAMTSQTMPSSRTATRAECNSQMQLNPPCCAAISRQASISVSSNAVGYICSSAGM